MKITQILKRLPKKYCQNSTYTENSAIRRIKMFKVLTKTDWMRVSKLSVSNNVCVLGCIWKSQSLWQKKMRHWQRWHVLLLLIWWVNTITVLEDERQWQTPKIKNDGRVTPAESHDTTALRTIFPSRGRIMGTFSLPAWIAHVESCRHCISSLVIIQAPFSLSKPFPWVSDDSAARMLISFIGAALKTQTLWRGAGCREGAC